MKKTIIQLLKLLFTIFIFVFIFSKFNISITNLFASVQYGYFIVFAILIVLIIQPLIGINRWKLFLKHSGVNESFFTLCNISFISCFLGILLPAQGDGVIRMVMIEKKHKISDQNKTASSTVIIERMIGFVLFALLGLIFTFFLPDFPEKNHVFFIIALINVLLWIVIFFITNKRCYQYFSALLAKINRMKNICAFIEKTHYSLIAFPYKKVLLSSSILIFLFQLSTVAVLYLIFLSFDVNIPFYIHLSFYPIIAILSLIPISISGLGLREGFFVYFYSLAGLAPEVAVGISIMNYCIGTLIPALIGGILYFLKSIGVLKV